MKSIRIIVFLLLILMLMLVLFVFNKTKLRNIRYSPPPISQTKPQTQDIKPKVISTSPSPLDNTTITPTQEVSITFNIPLQNKEEVRSSIDPKIDYFLTLSNDRKTIKISPKKTYGFSQGYTLTIGKETKFDGGKFLDNDLHYSFKTIDYSGV